MTNRIAVLGSINVDTTYHVTRFPQPGETISANDKSSAPGGKGANQAVAAARSGAQLSFIGMVGEDNEGKFMREALQEDGIDTKFLKNDPRHGTGAAVITLDANGQNDIMVYPGANFGMDESLLAGTEDLLEKVDFLIAQFETPQAVTAAAFKLAKEHGVVTILNPAPAKEILPELLAVTDVVIPNESESEVLTGIAVDSEEAMLKTAEYFKDHGVANLLITLGSRGVFYSTPHGHGIVPAFKVKKSFVFISLYICVFLLNQRRILQDLCSSGSQDGRWSLQRRTISGLREILPSSFLSSAISYTRLSHRPWSRESSLLPFPCP